MTISLHHAPMPQGVGAARFFDFFHATQMYPLIAGAKW
jgi:hypothetical protein